MNVSTIPRSSFRHWQIPKGVLKRAAPYMMQRSRFDLMNSVCIDSASHCCDQYEVPSCGLTRQCTNCGTIHILILPVAKNGN